MARSVDYDYLVIATGPELAFDEIEGFGPNGFTQSICQTDHAKLANGKFEELCANPRPIVVGAVQGASCYGPAYELAMILDTELKRRKIRDRVPMTFITPEPYIGHLGLDGVGDTKGLLESEMRNRHIKWITNAKVTSLEDGMCHVEEVDEDGKVKKTHDLPFGWAMMLPAFRGVEAVMGHRRPDQPARLHSDRQAPAQSGISATSSPLACASRSRRSAHAAAGGRAQDRLHDRKHGARQSRKTSKQLLAGQEPTHEATWNAICLADFGDGGVAFVAKPQIPPRNTNWSSEGKWVHLAKIGFEKYFLRKIRKGESEPFYEKLALHVLGVKKLRFD